MFVLEGFLDLPADGLRAAVLPDCGGGGGLGPTEAGGGLGEGEKGGVEGSGGGGDGVAETVESGEREREV